MGITVNPLQWNDSIDRKTARVMGLTYYVGANMDGTFFSVCESDGGEMLAQSVTLEGAINAAEDRHRKWVLAWVTRSECSPAQ